MARVLERVGNLSKAEEAYRAAWELRGRLRDSRGQALMLNGLGKLALQSRRYGDARTLLHQSLEISQRERFQDTATMALITLERVEERGNRPWEALAVMKRLRRIEAEAGKGESRNREFEILFRRERVLGLIAEQRRELEKSDEWLLRLLRRCVTPGWVDFEGAERPVVRLTAEGAAVMRGEKPARLLLPPATRHSDARME